MRPDSTRSNVLRGVAIVAALVGLVGYTVFGWRFGEADGTLPFVLGLAAAVLAVGWTVYQRV